LATVNAFSCVCRREPLVGYSPGSGAGGVWLKWHAGIKSNYAAILSASMQRSQPIRRFDLAQVWSTNTQLIVNRILIVFRVFGRLVTL
jgi:hypothetical protein